MSMRFMIDRFFGELLGYWCGGVSTGAVAALTGKSRQACGKGDTANLLADERYGWEGPSGQARSMRISSPEALSTCPSTSFGLISALGAQGVLQAEGDPLLPYVDTGFHATPEPDSDIFAILCSGLHQKRVVNGLYFTKHGLREITFSPHTIVRTTARVHFRGVMQIAGDLSGFPVDLVPSRFLSVDLGDKDAFQGQSVDPDWSKTVDVSLTMARDLPENLRDVIIQEWGESITLRKNSELNEYTLTIKGVRVPLVQYVTSDLRWRAFNGVHYEVWVQE